MQEVKKTRIPEIRRKINSFTFIISTQKLNDWLFYKLFSFQISFDGESYKN
jgi:hypothetical protein